MKPISEKEIQQFRADTKGTAHRIHFNNAGASLPPDVVVDSVVRYLKEESTYGGYETEYKYKAALDHVYELIAGLIHADRDEVAVVENASMAWGMAFNGIDFKKGDEVITSEMEYVTNMIGFIHARKTLGVEIRVIPNDDQGNFSVAALEAAITSKTKLIAITHIPSTAGNILPVIEIGKIARRHQILYMVDACQSVGQMPINVKEIDCDMLSATGRKYLRAPRGTGFLYVRKSVQDRLKISYMDGFTAPHVTETDFQIRNDARRFELYEKNRALSLGLGKAIAYAMQIGIDRIQHRVQYLADRLRQHLKNIEGVTIHDQGEQQSGIVTFSLHGMESEEVKSKLFEKQINVSVGLAQSTLVYMNRHHLKTVVRASVHYYNTEEEVQFLCEALQNIMHKTFIPVHF